MTHGVAWSALLALAIFGLPSADSESAEPAGKIANELPVTSWTQGPQPGKDLRLFADFFRLCVDTDGDPARIGRVALRDGYSPMAIGAEWIGITVYVAPQRELDIRLLDLPKTSNIPAAAMVSCELSSPVADPVVMLLALQRRMGVETTVESLKAERVAIHFRTGVDGRPRVISKNDTAAIVKAITEGELRTVTTESAFGYARMKFSRTRLARLDADGQPIRHGRQMVEGPNDAGEGPN